MSTRNVNTGCYWTLPSGIVTLLDRPPPDAAGDTGQAFPLAISEDGSVIVGRTFDADTITSGYFPVIRPARWDHGVLTILPQHPKLYPGIPWNTIIPCYCSADASVIVGTDSGYGGYWTGGGTTAVSLPPAPGGVAPAIPYGSIFTIRVCSSDGHVIIGTSRGAQTTRWVDGVPTAVAPNNTYENATANYCSADGNTISGYSNYSNWGYSNPSQSHHGFWRAPDLIWHPTTYADGAVNANGTVIWSQSSTYSNQFTDNLDTHDSNGIYGTPHFVIDAPGTSQSASFWFAEDTFSPNPIAAGVCTSGGLQRSTRTTGTTSVLLDNAGQGQSYVSGISGNGQIVVGRVGPGNGNPCYWDAAGTIHPLSIPSGWTFQSVNGVSRDGSTIFGSLFRYITVIDPKPPPGDADLALRLAELYPQNLPSSRFSIYSDSSADFPDTFVPFSLSMWCCEDVTLIWPQTDTPFGLLRVSPSQCYAEFRDSSGTLLFSGTFVNPHANPPKLYKLSFAIDTEAGTVICYGDNTEWTSTDAIFASLGEIGNIPV